MNYYKDFFSCENGINNIFLSPSSLKACMNRCGLIYLIFMSFRFIEFLFEAEQIVLLPGIIFFLWSQIRKLWKVSNELYQLPLYYQEWSWLFIGFHAPAFSFELLFSSSVFSLTRSVMPTLCFSKIFFLSLFLNSTFLQPWGADKF